jgi:hypothetical protein
VDQSIESLFGNNSANPSPKKSSTVRLHTARSSTSSTKKSKSTTTSKKPKKSRSKSRKRTSVPAM